MRQRPCEAVRTCGLTIVEVLWPPPSEAAQSHGYTAVRFGEVSERLKELVSKTSSGLVLLVSSNLTLSVSFSSGVTPELSGHLR